jgi:release factor glutamine methyltransferase
MLSPHTIPSSGSRPPVCDPVENSRPSLEALLLDVRSRLNAAGVPSPDVDADTIIGHVLKIRRSEVYLDRGRDLTPRQRRAVLNLVERRVDRVPLQILLGECEFMSLAFKVREGVFIPRPETECLVEAVIRKARVRGTSVGTVLDIGTGSGVIAVSLAFHLDLEAAVATDISRDALEIARANAILHRVDGLVDVVACDGLNGIRKGPETAFDVVVSNPPYVASGEIGRLEPEVRDHDPLGALDGGPDGMRFIAGLVPGFPSILRKGGLAALEIGAGQGRDVAALFAEAGLSEIEVVKDLAGLDRVVTGRRL